MASSRKGHPRISPAKRGVRRACSDRTDCSSSNNIASVGGAPPPGAGQQQQQRQHRHPANRTDRTKLQQRPPYSSGCGINNRNNRNNQRQMALNSSVSSKFHDSAGTGTFSGISSGMMSTASAAVSEMSALASSISNAGPSSGRKKSSFDVDAPNRTPLRKASSISIESEESELGVLTPEQRAWAGIESVLEDGDESSIATKDVLPEEIVKAMSFNRSLTGVNAVSYSSLNRSAAQMSYHNSFTGNDDNSPARHNRRTVRLESDHSRRNQQQQQQQQQQQEEEEKEKEGSPTGDGSSAGNDTAMPELADASFSSIRSDLTKQSTMTMMKSKNYVVQKSTSGVLPMQQFLGNRLQQQQQQQKQEQQRADPAEVCVSPSDSRGKTRGELLIERHRQRVLHAQMNISREDELSNDASSSSSSSSSSKENDQPELGEGVYDDDIDEESEHTDIYDEDDDQDEEHESFQLIAIDQKDVEFDDDDEDDDEDDGNQNFNVQQLIQRYSSKSDEMPLLLDSSFSSIQSDVSGIQTIISTAKNFVVQKTPDSDNAASNPMTAFLSNMTRNIERRQHASQIACEQERQTAMCERDPVADARRAKIEQFEEQVNFGYCCGGSGQQRQQSRSGHENDPQTQQHQEDQSGDPHAAEVQGYREVCAEQGGRGGVIRSADLANDGQEDSYQYPIEDSSMPSLDTMQESDIDASKHTTATTPRDWRSWVDSAFQPPAPPSPYRAPQALCQEDLPQEDKLSPPTRNAGSTPKPVKKKLKVKKKKKRPVSPKKKIGGKNTAPSPEPFSTAFPQSHTNDEDVIAMSPRSPQKQPSGGAFEQQQQQQAIDINSFACFGDGPSSPIKPDQAELCSSIVLRQQKEKKYGPKKPLKKLKKLGFIFSSRRRGSPASVLDTGRGEERFFPTIDEDTVADWGGLLS